MVMGSVSAPLHFIVRQEKKPYFHSALLTGDKPRFFFETEARTVSIRDMRARARLKEMLEAYVAWIRR